MDNKRMIGAYFHRGIDWIGDDEIYVPGIIPGTILNVLRYPTTNPTPKKLVVIEQRGEIPYPLNMIFNESEFNTCIVSSESAGYLGLDFGGDTIFINETESVVLKQLTTDKMRDMKDEKVKSILQLLHDEDELCHKYNDYVEKGYAESELINMRGLIRLKRREISKSLSADEYYAIYNK